MTARHLDQLFAPDSAVTVGMARTPGQRQLLLNLETTLPPARRFVVGATPPGWTAVPSLRLLPSVTLAVAFDGRLLPIAAIRQLAALGCHALIWATDVLVSAAIRTQARASGVRILGARSAGVARPPTNYNASAYAGSLRAGRIALIAQSRTFTAAALDWIEGRGLGMSLLAVTGAEADVDIADILDYAAVDPQTRAVALQVGQVRAGRRFMSAARACARGKPVVVLQTRIGNISGAYAGTDPVRSAAFARAGLVECDSVSGLFDALTALDCLPAAADAGVVVIGNGAAICALGVDALRRADVPVVPLDATLRRAIREELPLAVNAGEALDTGTASPEHLFRVIERVLATNSRLMVLLVHSPEPGHPHLQLARALFDRPSAKRVVSVWLGLATARAVRAECAAHGLATFASPDTAAQALRVLRAHRQTQELLAQTPPSWVGAKVDADAVAALLKSQRGMGGRALKLLGAYGVARASRAARGLTLHVAVQRHAEFGIALALHLDGRPDDAVVYTLPPLDGVLTRRALEALGLSWNGTDARALRRLALALLRLSRLVEEQPRVVALQARLVAGRGGTRCTVTAASMKIGEALPQRERLALTPYPSKLTRRIELREGACYTVRAIRPEDEPALLRMLEQTDPEAIRLRFFRSIRYFSHEMAARLTQIDYDRELVLVAVPCSERDDGEVVAMAHLSLDMDERSAEYAVLVHQSHTGRGLGRYLLERLLDYAATRGIETVYGEVLAENLPMIKLCRRLGFRQRVDPDDPQCLRVDVAPRLALASASDQALRQK